MAVPVPRSSRSLRSSWWCCCWFFCSPSTPSTCSARPWFHQPALRAARCTPRYRVCRRSWRHRPCRRDRGALIAGSGSAIPLLELLDRIAGVAVSFFVHRARCFIDDMHGGVFGAGITALVTQFGAQLATTVLRLVIHQANLLDVRPDAVGNLLAESLVEGVLMVVVIGRLLVVAGRDLALLRIAGDFLSWKRSDQVRLTFRIEILVFG